MIKCLEQEKFFKLKIFIDKEFKLDYECEPEITIKEIKLML